MILGAWRNHSEVSIAKLFGACGFAKLRQRSGQELDCTEPVFHALELYPERLEGLKWGKLTIRLF